MVNIKLDIPQKVSTNAIYSGMHWTKRKKIVDLYHKALIQHGGKKITTYPVEITYIFRFKGTPLDTLNCAFMAKSLEDGMRAWDILEDDSPKFVSSSTIYSMKGKKDEVEIIVN